MDRGDDARCDRRCLETDGSGTSDPEGPLDATALLKSVEHPRRRYVLYALDESGELTLADLATRIVAWERGVPRAEVAARDRDRAFIALYHAHVPKLHREGLVTFDRADGTVELGPNGRQALNALAAVGGSLDADREKHARDDDRD